MYRMSSKKQGALLMALMTEVRWFIAGAILFNDKVAQEIGLNATDLQCLHLLVLQGSATPGQLARWSSLTTGGMTVVLDRLEKAGYVKRERNPKDRRSLIVKPVLSKLRELEATYRSKGEALAGVLSGFKEKDLELILDFFRKVNATNRPGSRS